MTSEFQNFNFDLLTSEVEIPKLISPLYFSSELPPEGFYLLPEKDWRKMHLVLTTPCDGRVSCARV